MSESTAATQGIHHLGLTVPDVEATSAFFIDTLGFEKVGEKPHYPAIFVSDGTVMITIWQVADANAATSFDRKNVIGLHHLALRVATQEQLDALHARLAQTEGVKVEFQPEPLNEGPVRHMMCTIPGGIRVEFIALPI